MDTSNYHAFSTILVAIAFFGICWWAFSRKRRKKFEEAAQLPFADEDKKTAENTKENDARNHDL